ncbi:hypothetical protein M3Y99_01752700 [Aphelenchoides fujianensis]|nr:hypothetical protein M3Y99_01752700 [Aphelenchoides fujianensis]
MRSTSVMLAVVSVVAFAMVAESANRVCYSCNQLDIPNVQKVPCNNDKNSNVTCPTPDYSCGKITKPNKKDILGEGCLIDKNGQQWNLNGCQKDNMYNQDVWVCGCAGKDFCNSAGRPTIVAAFGAAALFVAAKLLF